MKRLPSLLAGLTGLVLLVGCASHPPLRQAKNVELGRYMGTWYVIGHVPYFAERGDVASADEYRRNPDGGIAVTYHYRKSFDGPEKTWSGKAWLPDPADALRRIRVDYRIVIVMRHFLNCSYRRIADVLGVPEKTVKSRLFTARHLMRDILSRRGMEIHD